MLPLRTEPLVSVRNVMTLSIERALLLLVLCIAAALRLWHLDFGLPALNDPDEPLFVMTAVDLLREQSLNPGWFGHPATVLFYALAIIFVLLAVIGIGLGIWSSPEALIVAGFADPGIAFLPMRGFILLCGVGCIYLTYRLAYRAMGPRIALLAAGLLAVNGLHIEFSQIIRTDMLSSLFVLAGTLFAYRAAQEGRTRDLVFAGMATGLALATKWPAGVVLFSLLAAAWVQRSEHKLYVRLAIPIIATGVTLVMASPYLLLDYQTVLRDLAGEARPAHLSATGGNALQNLWFYMSRVFAGSMGIIGAALVAIGLFLIPSRWPLFAKVVYPGMITLLISISVQNLVWERWAVPLLPFAAIAVAAAITILADRLQGRTKGLVLAAFLLGTLVPTITATYARTMMRANDTRQAAATWLHTHADPSASVLVEHAAFDLFNRPGKILFPLGVAGCVDGREALEQKPTHSKVNTLRTGRSIVDIGHLDATALPGCATDYAIFTHYGRYIEDAARFPEQLANYQALIACGRIVATFQPIAGERGGPAVHIVRFDKP